MASEGSTPKSLTHHRYSMTAPLKKIKKGEEQRRWEERLPRQTPGPLGGKGLYVVLGRLGTGRNIAWTQRPAPVSKDVEGWSVSHCFPRPGERGDLTTLNY